MEKRTEDDVLTFVMGFVAQSESYKQQFVPVWQEVLSNFLVEPYNSYGRSTDRPYGNAQGKWQSPARNIQLKDPETHKAVMTYASNLAKSLFGHRRREYISARPVGYEDWQKSSTTSRLLRYAMSLPGSFRTWVEAIVDMLLFGTAIIEVQWRYEERERPVRMLSSVDGIDLSEEMRMMVPSYDDVEISVVDPAYFYPDPGEYRIDKMRGVAKKFKMTALTARDHAAREIYDKSAVEAAISSKATKKDAKAGTSSTDESEWRDGTDQPTDRESHPDFVEMVGYEYWGEVPWASERGSSRRVITILNGVVVRNEEYPLADNALPFHTLIINPVNGRFYGVSPAEIIRYDQDFADALKILIATAVVRQVHPPMAFDSDSELDIAMLKRWKPDAVIPIRGGPSSIGTVRYDANVMNAFNMSALLKDSMQGTSGANGAVQGEEGPDREAATVGSMRMQAALSRPELAAMVLENECLPPIGRAILNRYQQFLEDSDALALRIGEQPGSVWLGEIMGDYDVEFVGSRMAMSRQQRLQSLDRLISMASVIPQVGQMVPWDFFLRDMIGETMELPDIAAQIGDPQTVLMNLLMQQMAGQTGPSNGNGQPVSAEPAGALPGQMSGTEEV